MVKNSRAICNKKLNKKNSIYIVETNKNPIDQVLTYLPLLTLILSFISNNNHTNIRNAYNYLLYHQLKNEDEYYIIRQMKNLFIRMIYSNLFTYLIIGNDEDIDDIENDTEDINEDMIYLFPDESTFIKLCSSITVSFALLIELSKNNSNFYVRLGKHICYKVFDIFYDKIWPLTIISDSIINKYFNIDIHIKSTTKENIDEWIWSEFEFEIPGCCIILLNFLKLIKDDQVEYFLSKITNNNKVFLNWIHHNKLRCLRYKCQCRKIIY
jgi:hypothetical protein